MIRADAGELALEGQFDIVTMVGSTVTESGMGLTLVEKAMDFVKAGGALYYQSIDSGEDSDRVIRAAHSRGMKLGAFAADDAYGFSCRYYKFERACCG